MSDIMQAEMKKKAQKWPMVKLGEVVIAHYGKALKKENRNESGIFDVYGSSGLVGKHDGALTDESTLIVGRKGSVGEIVWAENGGWVIDTAYYLQVLQPENLDLRYLFYALKKADLRSRTITTSIPGLNRDDFYGTVIPLPPLEEQKRIAAILDKADAIRRKRQQAIKLADEFLRSVFLDMFGDPVTNSKGWEVIRLGNVVESQLGKMLSQKAKVGNSPRKYLRNANVRWRQFNLDDLLKMDFDSREMEKFKLKNGDILVCEGGDVGRCSIWRDNVADCYYQKALHRVRPDLRVLTPEYVQEYFYWMSKRGGLSDSVSEVTFSHLTAEKLKELRIPIPPIELQSQFSVLYKNYETIVSKNESVLHVGDENFRAISQKAFSGEL